jgi:Outer membrane protein Omp28
MKRIFTLLMVLGLATAANAQYYSLPYLSAGENPKGLNTDIEQPQQAGWTTIRTTSATPVWSSIVTLPADFVFNFNGSPVTSYKVSTTGVLTFTTSAVTAPVNTNTTLPSAAIPDNSIMVWGLNGSGANDVIAQKTFGVAPNRQHWIQFTSYSAPGSTGTNWSYWGIVLEEGTNDIYIVDQRTYLTPLSLTLGIQIDGSTAYTIAGAPNTNSVVTNGGNADTPDDNAYYRFIYGTQAADDAEMAKLTFATNGGAGQSIPITGQIFNAGSNSIAGFTIKYLANGQTVSDTKTGLNIASGTTYDFTHATPFVIPSAGGWPIKVWVELTGDTNNGNDTLSGSVAALAFAPTKRIVFEEATGTWCQWCPRGSVFMDSLHKLYPTTAMLVAVHNNDPMVVTEYDAALTVSGYPSGLVDRKDGEFDPSDFIAEYESRINNSFTPCDVNVDATYNSTTRAYSIDLSATFATDLAGDLRFNCVIVEDDVTGTTSGYNQANAYSGGANGPMGNYHNLPASVPAAQMVYDHVARAILGGWAGTETSIPATVTSNSIHTYNYTYTLPAGYDPSQIHVIGFVVDAITGEILNANEKNFATGVTTQKAQNFNLSTFPNPSTGVTNFEVKMDRLANDISMEIYDLTGRLIYSTSEGSIVGGSKFLTWTADANTANGIYQAVVKVGAESVTAKVVLTR